MSKNEHLITPCPVCGMVSVCPHTPVRCQHRWAHPTTGLLLPPYAVEGDKRECTWCGRIEVAVIKWDTVKP